MPKITEAIQFFLRARRDAHNGPDLVDRWTACMETQVNVAAGDGEPVAGKRNTWTDGVNEWHAIRIPRNANSEPEFKDYELRFPLDLHAEAIGTTGWDWSARRSRWVGFDFDSITGHAAGVGVPDEELQRVCEAAKALPYVEVRKSTGGSGIHLYVYFDEDGIPTSNHTEHAALARCILGMMASATGFDFASQIDACGGNMWIWHRKMSAANEGLRLLKPAERQLPLADLPVNWRDHIEVVTRRRAKIRVRAVSDEHVDPFEALASSRKIVPLDDGHQAIIDELIASGFSTVWIPDHHLLQTHTKALAGLMDDDDKRRELGLIGFFQTNSGGKDPGKPNCFMFPLGSGAWRVYRFSPGITEAETWEQDGDGWTCCYFNRRPDLDVAAKAAGGIERPNNQGFVFETAEQAITAAGALGKQIDLPESMRGRETVLKKNKDGRLIVEIHRREENHEGMAGWDSTLKKDKWVRVFNAQTEHKSDELGFTEYDNILRALVSPAGDRAGWVAKGHDGQWVRQPKDDVKSILLALGNTKAQADVILGSAALKAWKLVNLPFQAEYPGNRQWNLDAAQYRFAPADLADDEVSYHPHWDRILRHIGTGLDLPIRKLGWALRANIKSGRDYLLNWIACMLREPYDPLPYLFLFGPQNSGKSILHEAISLLMTKGVTSADRALTNANDFNGELANAVLAYIEEKDISIAGESAYNKIKDWVTSPVIWIRKMRTDSYSQRNTLHFIQTANKPEACPIFSGDTRITMIFVPDIAEEIPKKILLERLEAEAPHFMRSVMDLTLPAIEGRLRLSVVATQHKRDAEHLSRSALERFIDEKCHHVPGAAMPFAEFFERFQKWLPADEKSQWNRKKTAISFPHEFPRGAGAKNQKFIGNIAWQPLASNAEPQPPLVAIEGKLRPQED
ncbi:MAG: hypothetical protein DWQ31_16885 [Planctomycetota bacterium]|nr:MAG: hypothetical protein DWQ31_16885 [Planctomycetota bacterium]REJ92030.1 MAG: hypothetical protein DWQ35_12835 [Planctomycetota bacterium]REK28566.1 MAG: hypothetical protein DWQ42_04425 [Planctomycetota bacterium]REK39181.1 MAG: hypothetical protein DWQ46_18010 [Planctomycetota bacterium]